MARPFQMRCTYSVDRVEDGIVHITDLNLGKSVTNDAENVVDELIKQYGNLRILYTDSCGNVDELLHVNGHFCGFAAGPEELNPARCA